MKKILAILTLMIMVTILASCGAKKEGSKTEEAGEGNKVETTEKANFNAKDGISTKVNKKSNTDKILNNKKSILSGSTSTGSKSLSGSTGTGKTEDQVVKDFEKELDGLFKLLESNPNAK